MNKLLESDAARISQYRIRIGGYDEKPHYMVVGDQIRRLVRINRYGMAAVLVNGRWMTDGSPTPTPSEIALAMSLKVDTGSAIRSLAA